MTQCWMLRRCRYCNRTRYASDSCPCLRFHAFDGLPGSGDQHQHRRLSTYLQAYHQRSLETSLGRKTLRYQAQSSRRSDQSILDMSRQPKSGHKSQDGYMGGLGIASTQVDCPVCRRYPQQEASISITPKKGDTGATRLKPIFRALTPMTCTPTSRTACRIHVR